MASAFGETGTSVESARMSDPAFFGYGSLVNLATHTYDDPRPAALDGWRRIWRRTTLRQAAYLSVTPAQGGTLQGIVARVPGADWSTLDEREAAYRRHDISGTIRHTGPKSPTALYQVRPDHLSEDSNHPILLSYLDVVVQGYLHVFGAAGVVHFFDTTDGWEAQILDDRADPIYPRHQLLTREERMLVDRHLAAVMK